MSHDDDGLSATPDTAELMQHEPDDVVDLPPFRTQVEGPVNVRILPRKGTPAYQNFMVEAGTPIEILQENPARARAIIIAQTDDVWFGRSRGDLSGTNVGPAAALWPSAYPHEYTGTGALYVRSTATQLVSVISESWAD